MQKPFRMNNGKQNLLSIYTALVANVLMAAMKFIGGGVTNSSSMISEGIHSIVDTTTQNLAFVRFEKKCEAGRSSTPVRILDHPRAGNGVRTTAHSPSATAIA